MQAVLIPVTTKPASKQALEYWIDNLKSPNAKIIVLFVSVGPAIDASLLNSPAETSKEVICKKMASLKAKWDAMQESVTKLAADNAVNVEFRIEAGSHSQIGEKICEVIDQLSGQLTYVIMAGRSMGKLRRTFTGSVSDFVVHHSRVPVMVLRQKKESDTD